MMIRKTGYILMLFLLTCCFGETNCPSFPDNKISWIPYPLNSVIKYSDGIDTVEFIIDETFKSNNYSFKNNCKCSCVANAYFKTKINNDLNCKIEGHSNYDGETTNYEYSFIEYGYSGQYYTVLRSDVFNFRNENGNMTNVIIAEYKINNKTYKNVIKLELDTIADSKGIWQMIIADSTGIIQFTDCKTRKTWKLIE